MGDSINMVNQEDGFKSRSRLSSELGAQMSPRMPHQQPGTIQTRNSIGASTLFPISREPDDNEDELACWRPSWLEFCVPTLKQTLVAAKFRLLVTSSCSSLSVRRASHLVICLTSSSVG